MAERPWQIDVAPVRRTGPSGAGASGAAWTDDDGGSAAPAHTDRVGPARRRATDPLLVALVAAGLVIALLKPWGATRLPQVVPQPFPTAAALASVALPGPTSAPIQAPDLPTALFTPAASTCMQDVGWRVCVLGAGGIADQGTLNHFDPTAPPLRDGPGSARPADPVVVLSTESGATLAFYSPNGFYIPDSQQVPRPTDEPDGAPAIASGPVSIAAWHVDDVLGARTLEFLSAGPFTDGGRVAANVFVPAAEPFSSLDAWPAGRYIVWINGGGSRSWGEFFDFHVVGGPTPR